MAMRLGESGFSSTPKTWVRNAGQVEAARPTGILQAAKGMRIVVYTALFGDKDPLWSVPPIAASGAKYIVFTEKPRREVGLWTHNFSLERPAILQGTGEVSPSTCSWEQHIVEVPYGNRRTARYYKMMAHKVLPRADISIWVDGNFRMLVPPSVAVERWARKGELVLFRHPDRRCLFEEVAICIEWRKGDKQKIATQALTYKKARMPRGWGLASTRCVIRRHTKQMAKLNEAWWAEIKAHSVRDQISLPYVCWKLGVRWGIISGRAMHHKDFWFIFHNRTV